MATQKQKRALTKVVENGGNVSRAMLEVGYSPATAKTPQKLTESKGWLELVEQHLPDSLVAEKHNWLLKQDNYKAVTNGVDMAYKLKGRYAAEKREIESKTLNVEVTITPQLEETTKEYEEKVRAIMMKKGK